MPSPGDLIAMLSPELGSFGERSRGNQFLAHFDEGLFFAGELVS